MSNLGQGKRIERVERMMPGFKVIAGPYAFHAEDLELRRQEIARCRVVKRDQQREGVAAKVLLLKDGAWVLRDEKGWLLVKTGSDERVRDGYKERELAQNRDLGGIKIRNGKGAVR